MSPIPLALTYNDVLLIPQYSQINSRSDVSLKTQITPKFYIDFPVVAANMQTIVGVDMAIALSRLGSIAFYPRFAPPEIQVQEVKQILEANCLTIPSVGIKPGEFDRASLLVSLGIKILLVDVAHGHQQTCLDFVKLLKSKFPSVELIVGAVATYDGAHALFKAGADTVKVGVGPGSTCTTRIMTGSGMPQITAIMECARAGKKFNRPIIGDGGVKNSGDVVKALAAGASSVMSGNLFAGVEETPGETTILNGKKYKPYNGSTSKTEKLRQFSQNKLEKSSDYIKYVEGLERQVPLRGSVASVVEQLDKGIRSGLAYSGAKTIDELHLRAKFVQVSSSVAYENHNRDLTQL